MIDKLRNIFTSRELIMFAIFGVLTSILNVAMFAGLIALGWQYQLANVVTLIAVKAAAYFCNKQFVFHSHCENWREVILEIARYILARGATMAIDVFGLTLFVEVFSIEKVTGKVIVTVIVIILNYILSKFIVFNGSSEQE